MRKMHGKWSAINSRYSVSLWTSISFYQYVSADKVVSRTIVGWGPSGYFPAEVSVKIGWRESIKVFETTNLRTECGCRTVCTAVLAPH